MSRRWRLLLMVMVMMVVVQEGCLFSGAGVSSGHSLARRWTSVNR